MKKQNVNFFSAYEPDMHEDGELSLTEDRVYFDKEIGEMFRAIGAKAVRIDKADPDTMQITPVKPTDTGATKLHHEGHVSFVKMDTGEWKGFTLSASYYPEDPKLGVAVYSMAEDLRINRIRLAQQDLAVA